MPGGVGGAGSNPAPTRFAVGFSSVDTTSKLATDKGFRFVHAHLDDVAAELGLQNLPLVDNQAVNHPNPNGHRMIAERLRKQLWEGPAVRELPAVCQ